MNAKQSAPKRPQCVIYARVSSAKQTSDGAGLASQEHTCREYAERRNYTVASVFIDVISGKYAERPGMNSLLAFLQASKSEDYIVIVDDIARFARDVSTHAKLREKILASGAKIESPNQKFGDDSSSRFVENIMAAVAAHERERNSEQSHRRSLARMNSGYWVLWRPIGYRYQKAPGGGRVLVKSEPTASIVKEALEGFAAGRFETQAEVKRFFESKPEFPRNYRNEVKWDTVKSILTNVLYSGHLEYKRWDIPLIKAKHSPLITLATFELIQERLSARAVAPARKNISADFPLRGFLICESCGHPLTGYWARSQSGKEYPYYMCGYRTCVEKGKSIPRDRLETELYEFLKSIVPAPETLALAEQLFRDEWAARSASAAAEASRLRARVGQINLDITSLLQSTSEASTKQLRSAYERRIIELETERLRLEEVASQIGTPIHSFDQMFELAVRFLTNPCEIWKKGNLETKRVVLRLVFASPLKVNRKTGLRTGETTYPFKALWFLNRAKLKVVRRAGYELTEAGYALLPVVEAMGHWGQEWIEPDLTVGDIDFGYLLWSLRRSVRRIPEMPESFLVRLHFTDAPDGHDLHWLSYRGPTSTSVTAIRAARSTSGSNAKWSPSPRSGWAGGHFRAACGIKGLSSTGPGSSRRIRSDGWGAAALRPSGNGPVRSGSNPFEARDGSLTKAIFDPSGIAQEGLRGFVETRAPEWLGATGRQEPGDKTLRGGAAAP